MRIGVVGSTGAVGLEVLSLLEKRHISLTSLRCFASPRSVGKTLSFRGEQLPIELLSLSSFQGLDVILFCAGKEVSLQFAKEAVKAGCLVIDASSAFRLDPEVPLVIPEINPHALLSHKGLIASPNCSTTLLLLPLAPLHREAGVERVVVATYQAASGAGRIAMEELKEETKAYLAGDLSFQRTVIPHPYAFNLFPHNSPMRENGYAEEEMKIVFESRKILEEPQLKIHATCVRVPVLRAHSEAVNVTFKHPLSKERAYSLLKAAPGVSLVEDFAHNRFAMPRQASCQEPVFCGRLRDDPSCPHTLDFWVVGDQLLKGAALNVVQILECIGVACPPLKSC